MPTNLNPLVNNGLVPSKAGSSLSSIKEDPMMSSFIPIAYAKGATEHKLGIYLIPQKPEWLNATVFSWRVFLRYLVILPFLPISSSKTTWLKSLATKSQSLPITRENSFIITNFSFRKAPSFLECTSMLGTLTKTFRLPGLFIPAWMASTPPEKNTIRSYLASGIWFATISFATIFPRHSSLKGPYIWE